jgi:putative transposase
VRAGGRKELVALTDGHRESTESWAGLLRDAKRRGMHAPALAVGDGALGFWGALAEVFPETRHQRDWVHIVVNVLDCLPKSAPARRPQGAGADPRRRRPSARRTGDQGVHRRLRRQVPQGRRQDHRRPGAAARLLRLPGRALDPPEDLEPDRVHLLDGPSPNQGHQGPGSRAAGLAMVFKLVQAAEDRWRYVNGPHLVALVRAGAKFEKGVLIERPDEAGMKDAA